MAVDTRNKRASAIAIKQVFITLGPNPDGSIAAVGDRQQMAREYAGIAAGAHATSGMMIRHHHHGL